MPAAINSFSEVLAELLHGPASPPTVHWGMEHRRLSSAVSFYNTSCHEGYKCVSKVDKFGRMHDGAYDDSNSNKAVKSDFRGTYEEGCPAKGKMTSSGECIDNEKGTGAAMCWTNKRYEAGKDGPCSSPEDCMCVKSTENGELTMNKKLSVDKTGLEKVMQQFVVEVPMNCDSCEAFSRNQQACKACWGRCIFTEKEIAGKKVEGCFIADPFKTKPPPDDGEDKEPGREYMEGRSVREESLVVLPHYPLWDPGDKSSDAGFQDIVYKMPFQSRKEPLSQDAWLQKYAEAAPRMQRVMDRAAAKVVKYSPDPSTHVCRTQSLKCLDNIGSKLEQTVSVQKACRLMQSLEMRLRKGAPTPFESKAPGGKGGSTPLNCRVGPGGMCVRLNCYSANLSETGMTMDKGALSCLQEKLEACLPEIRAADMRQKDIDNGLVDLHPTDGEIEKAPTEPTGPRLKSPKAAPKKSLAESMTPTTAPPEPGEDDIDYNDPKLIKQEQEAEKLADLDEKIIMDDAQKKLDSIPKAEFEAAEQIVEHDPNTLRALKAEERLEGPPKEPGGPAEEQQEREAEAALKQMGEHNIEELAKKQIETNPNLVVQEQQGEAMLDKLMHDPNLAAERKKAGITPSSFEGLINGGLAIWTAVGAASTCRGKESQDRRRIHFHRACREAQTLQEFLFPPSM